MPTEKIAYTEAHAARVEGLYREHHQPLVRYLSAKLRSEQDASEVAQEAYLKILNMHDLEDVQSPSALLFRIASNLAVDRLRRNIRSRQLIQLEMQGERKDVPPPEHNVGAEQEIALLPAILRELPPKCRKAFLLYRFRGVGFKEISEQMQLSERMIRIYVHRALAHCRSRLDEMTGIQANEGEPE